MAAAGGRVPGWCTGPGAEGERSGRKQDEGKGGGGTAEGRGARLWPEARVRGNDVNVGGCVLLPGGAAAEMLLGALQSLQPSSLHALQSRDVAFHDQFETRSEPNLDLVPFANSSADR
ncbi:hypothetical protein RUM43_003173 [Polyplax serrata]|uniref:Uncharacterized protein n=1 Tax=Polyplax serrata TaxID=468196 RepID=A0AAN8P1L0_POLSC